MIETITHGEVWAKALGIVSVGIFAGLIVHYILFKLFERIARHSETTFDDSLLTDATTFPYILPPYCH